MNRIRIVLLSIVSIFGLESYGQHMAMDTVLKKVNIFNSNVLHEKLYVHTDRTFYLTGETIWLKVYYVDAISHKPLNVSKIAYVEILDNELKPVLQTKISLENSKSGSLFLPTSLNSGSYKLRSYTSWMKNFGADRYYEQNITIINPFVKLGLLPIRDTLKYDAQFFPEGGNLVESLTSAVGFRVADQSGKGISFKGTILNENNDSILHFTPFKFGMGRFTFTPEKGHLYRVAIQDMNKNNFTYRLPPINEEGYVMHVYDTTTNRIAITIKSRFKNPIQNPTIYLLPQTGQQYGKPQVAFLNGAKTIFILDKKTLGDGISKLTIFNNDGLPVCERLYVIGFAQKLRAEIVPDQTQYSVRRKVNLAINVSGNPSASGDMSVAVYKFDSLQNQSFDIDNYLRMTSELKGVIESPDYYLDSDNKNAEAWDNLMLTHGWRRFNWSEVLAYNNSNVYEYLPETAGHIVRGKVIDASGLSAKGIMTYLSSPEKIIRLYLSRSNENGRVQYEMQNFYGNKELLLQTNTQQDSTYRIIIQSPFSEKYTVAKWSRFNLSENLKSDISQRSIHMQIQNAFYQNNNRFTRPPLDSVPFYGKPDETYSLDDFTRFPTMEEVMREYVPGVAVRIRKGKFHFVTLDVPNKSVFDENPLVLLDGMPIFDIDKIMAFDPRRIKKLDVMTRRYYLGALSFGGLVSYSTYKGDLETFQPDTKSLILNYEGLQLQREFFSPLYETQQARESTIPDTRNLLFWSPDVKSKDGKATVTFYTSDVTGKYNVVLQGITTEGRPISSSVTLDVRDKSNY